MDALEALHQDLPRRAATQWITPNEAAIHCRCTRRTIYRWIDAGLPTHRPADSPRHLIALDELDEFVRNGCFTGTPDETDPRDDLVSI